MDDVCAACLSSDRNLFFVRETGFHHLYSQILNEMQVYDVMELCIRVCWECSALLRKLHLFKQQVKQSYSELMLCAQNNTKPKQGRQRLQVLQVHNYSFPQMQIKLEEDDVQHAYIEDRLDYIKTEDTHCEPETFVKDLVEPKRRKKETKKIEKTIKEKAKRKVTKKVKSPSKTKKSPIEKKIKVKIKPRLPSPASDDDLDAEDTLVDFYDEKSDTELQEKKNPGKDDNLKEETSRLNGTDGSVLPEQLPERPHCVECGKNFSSRKTYRYHLNVLHKGQNRYPCPRCGKVYQWKSNLGRHLRSHKARDSGELYCETCDKRFASVATYRQHLRVSRRHVPESDFSFMCNECGKKFVNKTRLRDHIDWEHLKKIKFRCQMCNKPFKCHTSLYVHLQNVHRNKEKKDNLCHVCGKSYQNAAKLKYHIVAMHTSETPYQCQQCSAAFGWYSSLYRHVREVHYKMKVQPKKSKKTKKPELLAPIIPPQLVLSQMHQGGQT